MEAVEEIRGVNVPKGENKKCSIEEEGWGVIVGVGG